MDLFAKVGQAGGEILAQGLEGGGVDPDTAALHAFEHRDQGALQGLVDRHHVFRRQSRFERPVEAMRDVGVLGGVVEGFVQWHIVEGGLALSRSHHVLVLDGLNAQVQPRQVVHAVAVQSAIEDVGQHHGVVDGIDLDTVADQHLHVVLDVLTHLENRGVLHEWLE